MSLNTEIIVKEKITVELGPETIKQIEKFGKILNIPGPKLVEKIVQREIGWLNSQIKSKQYDCLQDYL